MFYPLDLSGQFIYFIPDLSGQFIYFFFNYKGSDVLNVQVKKYIYTQKKF